MSLEDEFLVYSVAQIISSILSFVGSATVLFMIVRSQNKFSTPLHRLLLGLCISDMVSAFSMSFASTLSPAEHWGWRSSGNMALCRTQGFLFLFGANASPLYNCSLCIYYLIEIKFTQWSQYLGTIEIFLHVIPIVVPLTLSIVILALNGINPDVTTCYIASHPFQCKFSLDIDCERGVEDDGIYAIIYFIIMLVIVPITIIGSMIVIYRHVAAQEERMNQHSFGRRGSQPGARNTAAARNRAASYSCAWFLSWVCFTFIQIKRMITGDQYVPFAFALAHFILYPLQGFFNFLVYIYPKFLKHWHRHGLEELTGVKRFIFALRDSIISKGLDPTTNRQSRLRNQELELEGNKTCKQMESIGDNPTKRPFTSIHIKQDTITGIFSELTYEVANTDEDRAFCLDDTKPIDSNNTRSNNFGMAAHAGVSDLTLSIHVGEQERKSLHSSINDDGDSNKRFLYDSYLPIQGLKGKSDWMTKIGTHIKGASGEERIEACTSNDHSGEDFLPNITEVSQNHIKPVSEEEEIIKACTNDDHSEGDFLPHLKEVSQNSRLQ